MDERRVAPAGGGFVAGGNVVCRDFFGRKVWLPSEPSGYHIGVTCPRCGSATRFVAGGSRRSWQQAAAIECTGRCHWRGHISVELSSAHDDTPRTVRARERDRLKQELVDA